MEKIRPNTPERGHENAAIEKAAAERLGQLENREQQAESNKHEVEAARETIRKTETMPMPGESEARPTAPTHILSPAQNYKNTMAGLQHRMKPAARTFSKFIHTPAVERSSEFVGKTVLRPSVTLGSTTTAVLFTGFLYFYARFYGFELHGSEIWISLIAGGVIGLLIEGIYKTFRRLTRR